MSLLTGTLHFSRRKVKRYDLKKKKNLRRTRDLERNGGDTLYGLIKECLSDKVTSERAEGSKGASHADIWGVGGGKK